MCIDFDNFQDFCYLHNIVILFEESLPTKVRGFCYYDGFYYKVVLNAKLSHSQLQKTTIHEIVHVLENHFSCSTDDLHKCESEVDYILENLNLKFT